MNKNSNRGLYAVAVAIAAIGAIWLGVPLGTLAILALVLACPLMMMFMMGGMHSGHDDDGQHDGGCHHDHTNENDQHGSHSHS